MTRRGVDASAGSRCASTRTASARRVEIALVDPAREGDRGRSCTRASPSLSLGGGRTREVHALTSLATPTSAAPFPARSSLLPARTGTPLQGDGSLRRPHPHHLRRRLGPPALERRARPWAGCPVCVIPMGRVEDDRARPKDGVILACFGNMMRVPGARGVPGGQGPRRGRPDGLLASTRCGSRSENPDRQVVFFAIGFETTAPSTALTLKRAGRGLRESLSHL